MNDNLFRKLALALPEASEQDHFGAPSFRARSKIFAQLSADGLTGLIKLPLDRQEWLLATLPQACAPDSQMGRHGWTRLTWSAFAPDLLEDLLATSWRTVAPSGLRKAHAIPPKG